MRAWLQMLHPEDVLSHAHVAAVLCRTGIECTRRTAPANGPGIVFFNDVTPAVYAILREATDNCRERVIAVATSREAAPAHAWTILLAGASDLLVWRSDATAGSIFERIERWQRIDDLVSAPIVRDQLVGRSAPWLAVVRQIVESAVTSDLPVLLTGAIGPQPHPNFIGFSRGAPAVPSRTGLETPVGRPRVGHCPRSEERARVSAVVQQVRAVSGASRSVVWGDCRGLDGRVRLPG
jgi:hypothetical protein